MERVGYVRIVRKSSVSRSRIWQSVTSREGGWGWGLEGGLDSAFPHTHTSFGYFGISLSPLSLPGSRRLTANVTRVCGDDWVLNDKEAPSTVGDEKRSQITVPEDGRKQKRKKKDQL